MGLGIVKGGSIAAAPPKPVAGFVQSAAIIIPTLNRPKTNA